MFCRSVLASVAALQFSDGRAGFSRRVLTLQTSPRAGDPDASLRTDLIGNSAEHRIIRGQAISWALQMSMDAVNAVLDKNDPEGLLRANDAEVAAASDTVSQWVDACLVPHPDGPDTEVDEFALSQMFESYLGWCKYAGVQYAMQRQNFMGQLRRVLGPARCLPRRKESRAEARADGRSEEQRLNLPRLDVGFMLRAGVLLNHNGGHGDRSTFNRLALGSGGLAALGQLPTGMRPAALRPASASQGASGEASSPHLETPATPPDRYETTPPVSGPSGPSLRADSVPVSGQPESLATQSTTALLEVGEDRSQGSPSYSVMEEQKAVQEWTVCVSPRGKEIEADSPETGLPPVPDPSTNVVAAVAGRPELEANAARSNLTTFRPGDRIHVAHPRLPIGRLHAAVVTGTLNASVKFDPPLEGLLADTGDPDAGEWAPPVPIASASSARCLPQLGTLEKTGTAARPSTATEPSWGPLDQDGLNAFLAELDEQDAFIAQGLQSYRFQEAAA